MLVHTSVWSGRPYLEVLFNTAAYVWKNLFEASQEEED